MFIINCIVFFLFNVIYKECMFIINFIGYFGCKYIIVDEKGYKDYIEIIEIVK